MGYDNRNVNVEFVTISYIKDYNLNKAVIIYIYIYHTALPITVIIIICALYFYWERVSSSVRTTNCTWSHGERMGLNF